MVVAATREKEAADLIPHVDDSEPAPGRWTAKDNLAHLSAWRIHAAEVLDAARTGRERPSDGDSLDERNAKIYAATQSWPASRVIDDARRSWDLLEAAIEACSADDLLKPRPGNPDQKAWEVVPGNAHFHLGEHLGYWSSERGDEAAAEAAARWAYELSEVAFPDDVARGFGAYNFGCFFARKGRARDAVVYLQRGLELVPSLRDWAKQDSDLDPIRSSPELVALLG
jgi:hypothetical protein